MATDVKLDENDVIIEGFRLWVKGADLVLDHPDRRSGAGGGIRRALVHGEGDALIVNFNSDYSGGVQLGGNLRMSGPDLMLDNPQARGGAGGSHRRALVHYGQDRLIINYSSDYSGGTLVMGPLSVGTTLSVNGDVSVAERSVLASRGDTLNVNLNAAHRAVAMHGILFFHGDISAQKGLTVNGTLIASGPLVVSAGGAGYNVGDWILQLRARSDEARARIDMLEERLERANIQAFTAESRHYTQSDWLRCARCSLVYFGPNGHRSMCPATQRPHEPASARNYTLFGKQSRFGGQPGWGWCTKCQGLSHGAPQSGTCAAGGQHDKRESPPFIVWAQEFAGPDPRTFQAESNWRWCGQCYSLHLSTAPGACPAASSGPHSTGGSSDYHLQYA